MKVLVALTLVVFTGCHANLFYADEPKTQLEQLTDTFWDYVTKATHTADDTLQMIKKSPFGQEVNARLTESADMASQYAVTLHEQLPPTAQHLMAKISLRAEVLRKRLGQDLSAVRGKLEPYAEEMRTQVQQKVEELGALRTTLVQKSEELKSSLEQSVKELQAQIAPYTEDMKQTVDQRLQGFVNNGIFMTDYVLMEVGFKVHQVRQLVDPYAQDLRTKLTSLYESYNTQSINQ